MAKKRALRQWELRIPVPPKEVGEEFDRQWPKDTTGLGAHSSGIEKTKAEWRLWVKFETDKEMYAFADWFAKQIGCTTSPANVRQYRAEDGEGMVDAELKFEPFH